MASREDWAWAAGFFDGEGWIGFSATERRVRAQVAQIHPEVLERLQSIWGCGRLEQRPPRGNQSGTVHKLDLNGFERCQFVVAGMWPWLGSVKRRQASQALVAVRSVPVGPRIPPGLVLPGLRTHCIQGHPYDVSNTYVTRTGKRHCRACRREWARAYNKVRPRRRSS